jgi:hypothetical protein
MIRGKLTLRGGIFGSGSNRRYDCFDYNGVIQRRLEFIATGETLEDVIAKIRKVLPEVKGVAGHGASERYSQEVAGLPMLAGERLDRGSFAFSLNFDDWEDLIAGASWEIDYFCESQTIILQ